MLLGSSLFLVTMTFARASPDSFFYPPKTVIVTLMARALFSLLLIPLGLAFGWVLRAILTARPGQSRLWIDAKWFPVEKLPTLLQKTALLGLNPIAIITSIWALNLGASGVATLPFIGLGVMAFGLLAGFAAMKFLHMEKDSGTVFSLSSSMTNLGSIGSLVAFLILGEQAFALVPFYKLFEEAWIYGLCFPLAAGVRAKQSDGVLVQEIADIQAEQGTGAKKRGEGGLGPRGVAFLPAKLLKDPMILFSLTAMGLGLALNVSGIPRPEFFRTLNAWIVPSGVFLVLVSIGMKIPKERKRIPRPALFAFLGIRLILIPAFSFALATLLGLPALPDQTAFKVAILLSFMPTAFASLIPPVVYGLDFGLSFSLWLVSNLTLAGTLPLLWILLR